MQGFKFLSGIHVFLAVALLAVSAHGENLKTRPVVHTNAPPPRATALPLTAELRSEIVPGFPPVTRVVASVGTNKFTFLAPRSFRIDASNPKKIVLISTNEVTFVAVQALHPLPPVDAKEKKKAQRSQLRKLLLAEHAGGKILSEFVRAADGCEGMAFDVEWPVAGALQSARVVFVPTGIGLLKFTLSSRPDLFHAATYKFNNVLLSFRASKNSQLEIVPLSNKF